MGTALVYHEDMTAARLLWDDPECKIECPERLTTALERLQQQGLEQRCLRLAAREASEAELGLVHSPEYVALLRGTQALGTRELQALSKQYDAVYLHPVRALANPPPQSHIRRPCLFTAGTPVYCALLAAAAEYLPLCPAGRRGRAAAGGRGADGSCAQRARPGEASWTPQPEGYCQRILRVQQRSHSSQTRPAAAQVAQGIQYIFEDDPSVLYFSWHRYEHGHFWPHLRESDADAVGRGRGLGFTVNLPWNQVGMGNADYVAAFLHVLLPLAFEFNPELVLVSAGFDSAIGDPEGQMLATPECFAHLTQLLQVLAGGRVCAILEGGYHLESLSQSVCMTVRALLGDPALPLSGPMEPHGSALESLQRVRAAQAPHWVSLQQQGAAPVLSPGTPCPEGRPSPLPPGEPEFKAAVTQAADALSVLLEQLHLHPTPPVRVAAALTVPDAGRALPPGVLCEEGSLPREEAQAWARPREALAQDEALAALGKVLYLLDRILDGQVSSGMAATPAPAAAATLDVAVRYGLSHGAQRLLCVAVGQLDRPPALTDDGRSLWLNIGGKEASAPSMFHVSVPLPVTTGGFLSCALALVLPLAYSFQPDLVLVALGLAHGLRDPQAALLAALLRGPAGGRVLALVDEESTPQLATVLASVLNGEAPPSLGPFSMATPEDTQALMYLRPRLEPRWKMLQRLLECCDLAA
ncbi:polyamine deacetylase HDAC10 isoform 2-T2 [Dama dama]|uniref:polyamine deacetylase HDAC10 isoform X1 n=1 Tax=Dama dama TaxID=30532 RepID=UPI002A3692C2|nr:polyamine deacetylase HDAC10 isoform X1 [Dama dama]